MVCGADFNPLCLASLCQLTIDRAKSSRLPWMDQLRVPASGETMRSSRTLRKLCQIRDLMRESLEEELTLADLSMEVDLSEWHFLRAFRAAFGETPHEFLTRMRLE